MSYIIGIREFIFKEDVTQKHIYNRKPSSRNYSENAVDIIETRNNFKWDETKGKWLSPDGKREIWFDDVWKYKGENGVVEEFTIISKYKNKNNFKTSTTGKRSFMQAHHGIQSKVVKKLFGKYYNPDEAPALLLRDSCKGTPHEYINFEQNHRITTSYYEERFFLQKDLKALQVPAEIQSQYLLQVDDYFNSIYRKMITDGIPLKKVNELFRYNFK